MCLVYREMVDAIEKKVGLVMLLMSHETVGRREDCALCERDEEKTIPLAN